MTLRATLLVKHRVEYKMVGKVFPIPIKARSRVNRSIFYHYSEGNQWHTTTNSPGGIDRAVLKWIIKAGVEEIHQDFRDRGLYVASPQDVLEHGIFEESDARARYYLPVGFWTRHPNRWYRVVWVPREKRIVDYELARKYEGIAGLIIPD